MDYRVRVLINPTRDLRTLRRWFHFYRDDEDTKRLAARYIRLLKRGRWSF